MGCGRFAMQDIRGEWCLLSSIFSFRFFPLANLVWILCLQIFRASTKRFEGNTASGSMLLAEYLRVKETLAEISKNTFFPSLQEMIDAMLAQLKKYQDEAVDADVIVLATILNPKYRLKFFDLHYPEHASRAKELIEELFNSTLDSWASTPEVSQALVPSTAHEKFDQFNIFTSCSSIQTPESIRAGELDSYLQGNEPIVPGQSQLDWWKVNWFFNWKTLIWYTHWPNVPSFTSDRSTLPNFRC